MFADLAHVVTATPTTRTKDALGNSTEAAAPVVVPGVLFAPEGLRESSSEDAPRLVGEATLYGALPALDSDATIGHSAQVCGCDGGDFTHTRWRVVGGSKGWGRGDRVVAIRRTGAA